MDKTTAFVILSFFVLGMSGSAAAAAPKKRCVTPREIAIERIIRHGVFLREASARCSDMVPEAVGMWREFDATYGSRLHGQTQGREKFFTKSFKTDAPEANLYFDGRLVTNLRNMPITPQFCANVKKLLLDNKRRGWGSFVRQAKAVEGGVTLDYKLCDAKR